MSYVLAPFSEKLCIQLKTCACAKHFGHNFTFFLSLIAVKLDAEYLPSLPTEVIECGKVFGIIGNERWPKARPDDVHLLLNQLDDKCCHDYDRVSLSPLKLDLLNKSLSKK